MTITQAIRISGSIVTKTAVLKRLKMGWHIRRAVETPPDMKRLLKKSSKSKHWISSRFLKTERKKSAQKKMPSEESYIVSKVVLPKNG